MLTTSEELWEVLLYLLRQSERNMGIGTMQSVLELKKKTTKKTVGTTG